MLNNKQIAGKFDLLAKLMELHDENPFKIKSYANAYLSLRKLEGNLSEMKRDDLVKINGVGATIADKIAEILKTGTLSDLQKYQDITPSGIQELLGIKGLGPKKVKVIWKEMEITSVGELLYACNENRLIAFNGFGLKVQADIKNKLEYFLESKGRYLYAHVHKLADEVLTLLRSEFNDQRIEITGDVRRMMPEVAGIELLATSEIDFANLGSDFFIFDDGKWTYKGFPVIQYVSDDQDFDASWFKMSCSAEFATAFSEKDLMAGNEEKIFLTKGVSYIPAEYREDPAILQNYMDASPILIREKDIKGIVHNHSTYSDGLHTLEEMADYVHVSGYEYFVISDHSKSAGYAGGLNEERVMMQWREIDTINSKYSDGFKVFKSIESDILTDGSLDYSDDILAGFDLVIASVHSVLNMDETKATARLIRAVENPYTKILGHPTGRLLLARPGYPVDYKKLIDACAANGVVLELNANPQRLDVDWTWIPYALEKNVMIAINPDAHSKESIHYVKYGVAAARKGGLTAGQCINTKNRSEFESWLHNS